jgi:phosphoribosylanthranilate isomerase
MFKIKICGITTPDDALLAAAAGADAIGLNFYEKSPRCVWPEQSREIVGALLSKDPDWATRIVGVTVNQGFVELLQIGQSSRVMSHQLHGDEPSDLVVQICKLNDSVTQLTSVPAGARPGNLQPITVRAFRCPEPDLSAVAAHLDECRSSGALPTAVLLDAHQPGAYGGTGQTLDWNMIRSQRDKLLGLPLILAGGLTPDNVAEAIRTARPDAVDVASGVESAPGKKDTAKVRDFIAAAKAAFAALD